jgi:hypothetical protein
LVLEKNEKNEIGLVFFLSRTEIPILDFEQMQILSKLADIDQETKEHFHQIIISPKSI